MLLGITEYARYRKVGLWAVQKAVQKGHIRRNADGYIDTEEADRAWQENVRETPERKPCAAAEVAVNGEGIVTTVAAPGMTFAQARTLTQVYKAQVTKLDVERTKLDMERTKLDIDKRQGLLVRRDEVTRVGERADKLYREYRDRLLELPARLATILAAESNPNRVLEILDDELRRFLTAFAEAQ